MKFWKCKYFLAAFVFCLLMVGQKAVYYSATNLDDDIASEREECALSDAAIFEVRFFDDKPDIIALIFNGFGWNSLVNGLSTLCDISPSFQPPER